VPKPALADLSLEGQVQSGLNLFLHLKSPAQMPALLAAIAAHQDDVNAAHEGLHYVHFARFLPSLDGSTLMVITVFDGPARTKDDPASTRVDPAVFGFAMKNYIMDFVAYRRHRHPRFAGCAGPREQVPTISGPLSSGTTSLRSNHGRRTRT
jgi:hypothetical protein